MMILKLTSFNTSYNNSVSPLLSANARIKNSERENYTKFSQRQILKDYWRGIWNYINYKLRLYHPFRSNNKKKKGKLLSLLGAVFYEHACYKNNTVVILN